MKIEDVLDLLAPDVAITICEEDGRLHYAGKVESAHSFDAWDLAQIRASDNHVVLIISTNDMLV